MNLARNRAWQVVAVAIMMCTAASVRAQAPAGSTGQCNDGSYSTAAKKWQACRGHQGVKSWFADSSKTAGTAAAPASAPAGASAAAAPASPAKAAPARAAATAPAPAPAAASSPATAPSASGKPMSPSQRAAATPQAAGGGPGLVWVNTETKVYHCAGTTFYGKTKAGKYMSEADAKTAGARPDRGKACSQ